MRKTRKENEEHYIANKQDTKYQEIYNFIKTDQTLVKFFKAAELEVKAAWFFFIASVTIFVVGGILAYVVFHSLIIMLITIILGITSGLLCWHYSKKVWSIKKKKIFPYLMKMDWKTLYNKAKNIYFENDEWEIMDFEQNSLIYSSGFQKNLIAIKYKEAKILFKINSFIEEKTVGISETASFTKYRTHVDEWTFVTRGDLIFEDKILLQRNVMFSKGDFEFESIEFNKKFEIFSKNQLLALKVFSPKAIDQYANIEPSKQFADLCLDDKGISTHFYKLLKGSKYFCELGHLTVIANWKKFSNYWINKILDDLYRFWEHLLYIEPLL